MILKKRDAIEDAIKILILIAGPPSSNCRKTTLGLIKIKVRFSTV